MTKTKRILNTIPVLALIFGTYIFCDNYIVINKSRSLPGHVYFINHNKEYHVGSLILYCPDAQLTALERIINNSVPSSRCKTEVNPLIKIVAAMPKTKVYADGIHDLIINGRVVRNSKPIKTTAFPRWKFSGVIPNNQLVVLTPNPLSLDSRYYGTISTSQVISTVTEIF